MRRNDALLAPPYQKDPVEEAFLEGLNASLAEFERGIEASVGRFTPFIVALRREASPLREGWDRITADMRLAQFARTRFGLLASMLSTAPAARVAPISPCLWAVSRCRRRRAFSTGGAPWPPPPSRHTAFVLTPPMSSPITPRIGDSARSCE